jgi:hypothetical protein
MSRSIWNGSQWIGAPASAPETQLETPDAPDATPPGDPPPASAEADTVENPDAPA